MLKVVYQYIDNRVTMSIFSSTTTKNGGAIGTSQRKIQCKREFKVTREES